MRRGLMQWDAQELPLAALEARIARLRAAMQTAGLDAFIVYTNLVRPSAVAHLTGFTPYWSEGLLLVPMTGGLVFATALSNRVADWIRSTNPVSEVVSTPRPGALLGERLKAASAARVGVLELDAIPAELAEDLANAAPATQWLDGGATFAALRGTIDATERQLLARADALAVDALNQIRATTTSDAGALAGLVEKHARLAGAEEVYVAIAPDLAADRRFNRVSKPVELADFFAVRASVAYKGSWVRRTRTFARNGTVAPMDAWFERLTRGIETGKPLGRQIDAAVGALPGAALKGWMAESSIGSYPLTVIASSRLPGNEAPTDGQLLVLTTELLVGAHAWVGSAPMVVGRRRS